MKTSFYGSLKNVVFSKLGFLAKHNQCISNDVQKCLFGVLMTLKMKSSDKKYIEWYEKSSKANIHKTNTSLTQYVSLTLFSKKIVAYTQYLSQIHLNSSMYFVKNCL